jgi:cell division protein FtsL
MRKKEINLVKHTETIDRLVLQNKQLQKDLNDADMEIEDLEKKVEDSSLRISKNLFYIGLVTFLYMVYVINGHLTTTNIKLNEANTILKEYKAEIEKTKLYNDILEKRLGISEKK